MHTPAHQVNSLKSCTGPCPVPFEDLVDTQCHAQCVLQQAIKLNSARTHAHQVNSFKSCTGSCPVPFEHLVDRQDHVQCLLQQAINPNSACTHAHQVNSFKSCTGPCPVPFVVQHKDLSWYYDMPASDYLDYIISWPSCRLIIIPSALEIWLK